ncbi:hypothetical protein DV738_g1401, partial [Chaetothyriales sp. CBS 135597]
MHQIAVLSRAVILITFGLGQSALAGCPGWGLSTFAEPSQWAAPLVQFVLPSAIFVMTVPKSTEIKSENSAISRFVKQGLERAFGWTIWLRWLGHTVEVIIITLSVDSFLILVDIAAWILVIFTIAGPLLVDGLLEMILDYRILSYIKKLEDGGRNSHIEIIELLLTVVSGNLALDKNHPQINILNALSQPLTSAGNQPTKEVREELKARLLAMLTTQMAYGGAVGAPVLFYLGSFFYNIIELNYNPASQDAAIGLAFGLEWMVIVHVAMLSGCLLASNNPSTACAIVGIAPASHTSKRHKSHRKNPSVAHIQESIQPQTTQVLLTPNWLQRRWEPFADRLYNLLGVSPVYETAFQPVPMRLRGRNKLKWLEQTKAWQSTEFRHHISLFKWLWLFPPTAILILFPSIAGGFVAYVTPPVGFGCRSLSFITYAAFQFLLIVRTIYIIDIHSPGLWQWLDNILYPATKLIKHISTAKPTTTIATLLFWTAYPPLLAGSLFTGLGGTLMQLLGIYRTCLCYINAPYWLNLNSSPGVDVASDTQGQRNSSRHWLVAGWAAIAFMGGVCYLGWEYQKSLRLRFMAQVEKLTLPENEAVVGTMGSQAPQAMPMNPTRIEAAATAMRQQSVRSFLPLTGATMDVDITDILAEAGRGGSSSLGGANHDVDTAYTDHILLTRAWTSERCTPALLPYPSALIDRVMQRVRSQIARIEDLASGISDGSYNQPPPSNQNLNLILSILQTDLSRTQFLIRSLLRQRLAKISKFAQFYLQQLNREEAQNANSGPLSSGISGSISSGGGGGGLLSPAEARFLRHHQALLHSYYDATFLAGFPPALRRLDDSSGGVSMVDGPDVDAAVVVRCLVPEWSNEADDGATTELQMHQGDVMIARWRDVSRAVVRGLLELLNLNLTWRDVVLRQYNADYDAGCPFPLRYLINATPWKRDIFIEVHEKIDKKVFRRAFLDFFLAQHKGEPVCKNEYISVYPRPRAEEFIVDHGGGGDDKKKREEKNVTEASKSTGLPRKKNAPPPSSFIARSQRALPTKRPIANVKKIVAVSSAKGGVGKSTVSTFLRVGLLDADIFGPSVPTLLGLDNAGLPEVDSRGRLQLLHEVHWPELDVLVIDMPPGTGDVQLTIGQQVAVDGAVIVSTPQDVALKDAIRGVGMFAKMGIPVLGMVLGQVPLDPQICYDADRGMPTVVAEEAAGDGKKVNSVYYEHIARQVAEKLELV